MTTVDEVISRAEAKSRRCLRLAPSGEGTTHLGGHPELPVGFEWPIWKGNPLAFLGQVSLTAASKEDWPSWMPERGRLLFFYDAEQSTWGFDPTDRGSWRVYHIDESADSSLVVLASACQPAFPRRNFRLVPAQSPPSWERVIERNDSLSAAEQEAVAEHLDAVQEGERSVGPLHQLFGLPIPIQADEMELECQLTSNGLYTGDATGYSDPRRSGLEAGVSDWELLLQIDSDEDADMMWGDAGMLYFWVRRQDAEAADFSNVWMILQCG